MGPFHRNSLLPAASGPVLWTDDAMVIHPDTIDRNQQLMRDYPLEQTEAGELYALVPQPAQPPELPPWRTEVVPEMPEWDERRVRSMATDYLRSNPLAALSFGMDYLKRFLPSTPSQPPAFDVPQDFAHAPPMNRLLPQRRQR